MRSKSVQISTLGDILNPLDYFNLRQVRKKDKNNKILCYLIFVYLFLGIFVFYLFFHLLRVFFFLYRLRYFSSFELFYSVSVDRQMLSAFSAYCRYHAYLIINNNTLRTKSIFWNNLYFFIPISTVMHFFSIFWRF